jgi:hypothetical protein
MASRWNFLSLFLGLLFLNIAAVLAQAATSSGGIAPPTSPPPSSSSGAVPTSVLTTPPTTSGSPTGNTGTTSTSSSGSGVTTSSSSSTSTSSSTAPDVLLNVPQLSVGRIELDVDNLVADINLNANVASLVKINAGVAVSITKVNITIADVDAQLELIVRLGHLVDIVQRVFQSLDLNPLLITLLNDVTEVVSHISRRCVKLELIFPGRYCSRVGRWSPWLHHPKRHNSQFYRRQPWKYRAIGRGRSRPNSRYYRWQLPHKHDVHWCRNSTCGWAGAEAIFVLAAERVG